MENASKDPVKRQWWRRPRTRRVVAVVVLILAGLVVRWTTDTSPIGHFASAQDKDRYMAAYRAALDELPPPQQVTDIRTAFGIVRLYRFTGADDGDSPLLLLPGRAAAAPMWADNLPGLLRHRSVYVLDLLGEPGMSVQDRPLGSDEDQAAWLHEVLVQLPEDRVHLVGSSIGGWTAMNLAVHEPAKIASLTLIEPVLVFADLSPAVIVRSIPASVPWLPRSFRDAFNSWTANDAPVEDEPVADMIEAGMQHYRAELPPPSLLDPQEVAAVAIPTLVILAEESRMHDAQAAADTAAQQLEDGTVSVYPDTSHAVNGERPDEIADAIAAHLAASD